MNPLNNIDNIDELNPCILANIKQYQELTKFDLEQKFELTCGCEEATLKDLIFGYECTQCGEEYRYSLCWDNVVEENHSWHCQDCGKCKEYREWHCDHCGRCTYGLSLPCEDCGRKRSLFK